MCLPPTLPPYMAAVGSFIAIVIAKHAMGGLGQNIFNPAHIGRAALMVSSGSNDNLEQHDHQY